MTLAFQDKTLFLKKVPLFSKLHRKALEKIARITRPRRYKSGQMILKENERGNSLFMIVSGMVKIYSSSRSNAARKTLALLRRGDFFGEMALLDHEARSASALALSDTETLTSSRRDFGMILKNNPSLCMDIMSTLASRLRDADKQIGSLTFQNILGRVAVVLLDLASRHGVKKIDGIEIGLDLTHQDLAEMVGTAREMVTKVISRFKRSCCVKLSGRRITVTDIEKLKSWIY